ncbi:MAG: hypothetical protein ABEJ69_00820 [Candidatus Nanohaloarchaea archaeon]
MSNRRGLALLMLLVILFSGAATAQITGGGGNVFGLLDSVAAADIDNSADFVIFVLLPFVGMYGLFWFLIRKALLLTEHNFGQNTGLGGGGELSDTGKKASSLMAAAMATLFIFAYGGLTVPFALIIGLLGGLFFLWQTLGVVQHGRYTTGGGNTGGTNTGGNPGGAPVPDGGRIEDMTETVSEMETEVRSMEDDIQKREKQNDRESIEYSAEELSRVAEELEREAELIEDIQSGEAQQIRFIAKKGNEFVRYKKREQQMLARFRELEKESRDALNSFFPQLPREAWLGYAEVFKEFLEDRSFNSEKNKWNQWRGHKEKNSKIKQLDSRAEDLDGLSQALSSTDLGEKVEEFYSLLERMDALESDSSSDLQQQQQELEQLVMEQKNALKAMKKFTYSVETAFEEGNTLKKLAESLGDPELKQKASIDREKIDGLRQKFKEIENQENTLIELEGHIEDLDRKEMERFKLKDMKEAREKAREHLGRWLVVRDLALTRGIISKDDGLYDALNRITSSFQAVDSRMEELIERENSQRNAGRDTARFLKELEQLTEELIRTLLNRQNY